MQDVLYLVLEFNIFICKVSFGQLFSLILWICILMKEFGTQKKQLQDFNYFITSLPGLLLPSPFFQWYILDFFFGDDGVWCWIKPDYPGLRFFFVLSTSMDCHYYKYCFIYNYSSQTTEFKAGPQISQFVYNNFSNMLDSTYFSAFVWIFFWNINWMVRCGSKWCFSSSRNFKRYFVWLDNANHER